MQLTVHRATPGERGGASSPSVHADGGAGDQWPGPPSFVDSFSAWVHHHLSTHLPFIAELDDRPAGMAWFMIGERVPSRSRAHRPCGDVQSVYVLPQLRDQGIGAAPMDAVLAEASKLDLEQVTVHSSRRAGLYQRRGFQHDQRWLRWAPE